MAINQSEQLAPVREMRISVEHGEVEVDARAAWKAQITASGPRGVRPRLTTKVFNPMEAGSDRGLEPDRIARQLRSSLDRLGVDHVDLYLAHDYDDAVPLTESLGAFRAAQADGLIGSGVSLGDFTVLIVVGLCALMAAVAAFRRADLNWRTGAPRGQRRVQSLIVYGVGWAPTASTTPLRTPGDAWRRLATISPAS